ncbi:unnamed protein product [Dovyalis caffra]|uniref:Uncharacterized protein n=1 Tax=Dovyalis caffra TaxID=77055 RepID=A0AAV1QLV4_9ROSI|nr:unnamed protein product [Dovyalis caffra]
MCFLSWVVSGNGQSSFEVYRTIALVTRLIVGKCGESVTNKIGSDSEGSTDDQDPRMPNFTPAAMSSNSSFELPSLDSVTSSQMRGLRAILNEADDGEDQEVEQENPTFELSPYIVDKVKMKRYWPDVNVVEENIKEKAHGEQQIYGNTEELVSDKDKKVEAKIKVMYMKHIPSSVKVDWSHVGSDELVEIQAAISGSVYPNK